MRYLSEWQAKQLIFGRALEEITICFARQNLTFMPIKGAYLIITDNAGDIADRKMMDIDLLIPEKMFDATCDWFRTLQGVSEKPNYWDFERSFVYTCAGLPVYFEFHRSINFPARFLLENETLFSRGSVMNGACILPDPVDALLIHICHMLVHVVDGFGEQRYREIEIYTQQKGFFWKTFWERAHATGIGSFIWLAVRKCFRISGAAHTAPPAPSVYAAIVDKYDLFMRGKHPLVRKLFFEIPFVRNVWWLLWYKARRVAARLAGWKK